MDRDLPEPQSFDPEQSTTPVLPDPPPGGGLVLLVAESVADRDWAERAAVVLATGWAGKKRRILLADLALSRPGLHLVLGVENSEGMSDAFLFGSSVLRVAHPVRERGFLFVPAGTATARPEAVAGSPRWASVVDACDRIRATLVVFLPSDLPGGEHLLARASDVFLLTDASANGGSALRAGLGDRLRAVLVPPGDDQEAVDEAGLLGVEVSAPTSDESADAFAAFGSAADMLSGLDLDLTFQEAEAEDPPTVDGATTEMVDEQPSSGSGWEPAPTTRSAPDPPDLVEPIQTWTAPPESQASQPAVLPVARPAPRAGALRSRLLVLLFLLVLVALAAVWYGVVEIPWISPWLSPPDVTASVAPA